MASAIGAILNGEYSVFRSVAYMRALRTQIRLSINLQRWDKTTWVAGEQIERDVVNYSPKQLTWLASTLRPPSTLGREVCSEAAWRLVYLVVEGNRLNFRNKHVVSRTSTEKITSLSCLKNSCHFRQKTYRFSTQKNTQIGRQNLLAGAYKEKKKERAEQSQ